jgi:class 3 adenylate cyclase
MNDVNPAGYPWDNYKDVVVKIIEDAREKADAEVGVLFLSSDGIFLEAADWRSEEPGSKELERPPASELPTYRLDWWNPDDTTLDGLTAYVAIRRESVNLSQKEVFDHPAHQGKWDAVFLEGERMRCGGIMAVPLQSEPCTDLSISRMHGVLKVENPKSPNTYKRFNRGHQEAFTEFARRIASELDKRPHFWQQFVQSRADLKVSQIVELLEKGRSLQYNLSLGLGYVLKLFSLWLGCKEGVHVFWKEDMPMKDCGDCHLLRQWDLAAGESPEKYCEVSEPERESLLIWLKNNVSPKVVQPDLRVGPQLWSLLFDTESPSEPSVDVMRLKSGRYDLGAFLLPHSSLLTPPKEDKSSAASAEKQETLTRLALNVVSILGRFIEDEYETNIRTYLPKHRMSRVSKTCTILFGDIRNFSQLTQILRLMGKPEDVELFLDCFCARIGKVINDTALGRVDKFMGDGVMALFGETLGDGDDSNAEKAVAAVVCAKQMSEEFDDLYKEWFEKGLKRSSSAYGAWRSAGMHLGVSDGYQSQPLGELIGRRFNENVRVNLGIGINIGEVFFDYFGYGSHRKYTAVGDHVNFAQRLQTAASELDERTGEVRSNIIISQTVYQYLSDYGYLCEMLEPLWLRFKGFGFMYPVFELRPSDLDFAKISAGIQFGRQGP